MGRDLRIQFEGAVYHIYPRGNRRLRIAHDAQDYRILEKYMIEAARKTGVIPRAWYPMPNHFHAILETPYGNLSEFVQQWLGRYARYYNRRYRKVGHLFRGRFGSRLVQKDTYLKELIRYVHLQRYRAKHPNSVDKECDYYSSHRFYMGEICPPEIKTWFAPMLELFGTTHDEARRNYTLFLSDGLKEGRWKEFYKPKRGILGDDTFRKFVEKRAEDYTREHYLSGAKRKLLAVNIRNAALDLFNHKLSDLCSPSQRRDLTLSRKVIAVTGFKKGLRVIDIARILSRSHQGVSAMIQTDDKDVLHHVKSLTKKMLIESSAYDHPDIVTTDNS